MFNWLKDRTRRRVLAKSFPDEWHEILARNVKHYAQLSDGRQAKLRDDLRILVAEKNWEGCGSMQIDDEVRVTIAAQAGLLLLGLQDQYFDTVRSILVYPDVYVAPDRKVTGAGVVVEGRSSRAGEAWYRGPVVLSWPGVLAGGRWQTGGNNLVLHEFAHQLDMLNGDIVDGTPPLETREQFERWQQVIHFEHERLIRDCRSARPTVLDCYGTMDIGEFFAVATESFFQQPQPVAEQHPDLYEILSDFYRQDPASGW